MLKKVWAMVLVAVAALCLAGCKDKNKNEKPAERTYVADGSYVAYGYDLNYGAPQLTWVTVTIKNDKISDVDINTIQSAKVLDGETTTGYAWNAKNKKELGYEYYMFPESNARNEAGVLDVEAYKKWLSDSNKKEWFEQVELLEAKIVADQNADGFTVSEGKVTNVTGVTVSASTYVTLAKEAIANAKAGKVVAVRSTMYGGSAEYVVATATVDANGKLSNVVIDERQSKTADGVFTWNEKTKQELGYNYGLQRGSVGWDKSLEEYKNWLTENDKLEWFEEVALIVNVWKNGTPAVDSNNKFTNVTGCTISNVGYAEVLEQLLTYGFKK